MTTLKQSTGEVGGTRGEPVLGAVFIFDAEFLDPKLGKDASDLDGEASGVGGLIGVGRGIDVWG